MSKRVKIIVVGILVLAMVAISFGAGCALGASTSSQQGLEVVAQAWNIIFQDYVDKDKLDTGDLTQGAISGMVEALDDPYTAYLDAETYQSSLRGLEGQFEGIGAYVAVKDEQIEIIAPIAGSPAERAGIRAGDVILEVDGQSTVGMSLTEAVLKIQGPEGTAVTLSVLHQGETEAEVIEMVRAKIRLPSVRSEMRGDIAYINISYFSERTAEELSPVIEEADQQAVGIILDLRGNPGGLLETVIDVASFFLKDGVVVDVVDNEGKHTTSSVRPGEITTDLPLVVLVDSYSASGSEVLAGALQDYGRATIAGSKTYGKGSADIMQPLKDGSALYITYARWLTPNGRLIEGKGLDPDYTLKEGEDAVQWAIDFLKSH